MKLTPAISYNDLSGVSIAGVPSTLKKKSLGSLIGAGAFCFQGIFSVPAQTAMTGLRWPNLCSRQNDLDKTLLETSVHD